MEDHVVYGSTFMLKRGEFKPADTDSFRRCMDTAKTYRLVWEKFKKGEFEKALEQMPAFPQATIMLWRTKSKEFTDHGLAWIEEHFLNKYKKFNYMSSKFWILAADIFLSFEAYDKAFSTYSEIVGDIPDHAPIRPNDPHCLMQMGHGFRALAEKQNIPFWDQIRHLLSARNCYRKVQHTISE